MSAPTIDRRSTSVRDGGGRGTVAPPRIPAQRTSGRGAERVGTAPRERAGSASARRAQVHAGRAKFVLIVMTLLVCGLVASLWLSTAAAADSYRLQEARSRAGSLTEQSEQLRKQVTAMDAPGALADRASALGLVPVQDPARLVVAPDGRVDVVGEPTAARGSTPSPAAPVVPAPAGPTAATGQAPAAQTPATQTPATQTPAAQTPAAQTPAAQTPAAQTPAAQTPAAQTQAPAGGPGTSDPAAAEGATTAGGNG